MASSPGATVGRKRAPTKRVAKTPSAEVAQFLSAELDRRGWDVRDLYDRMKAAGWTRTSEKTIYAWRNGQNQIPFDDLIFVAKGLGYANWIALAVAVGRHQAK